MIVRRKARRTNTLRPVVRDGNAPGCRGLDGSGGAALTPDVTPCYYVMLSPQPDFYKSVFPPVPYQTWFSPRRRFVLIQREFTLPCGMRLGRSRESIVSGCLFVPHIPHIKSVEAGLVCDHCGTPRTRRTDKEKLSLGWTKFRGAGHYYRWRKKYGGLKMDQVKQLKEVEQENTRLRNGPCYAAGRTMH
jgi:hypothetical protein